MKHRQRLGSLSILSVFIFAALSLYGRTQPCSPVPPPQQGISTSEQFATFANDLLPQQMERLQIPGAVLLLVKDGRVFFTNGYGYADLDKRTPVSPEETLFRLASVTKTFTATAVMQLAEAGKLNLTDDVTRYAGFLK